jgi:hypothetical protein
MDTKNKMVDYEKFSLASVIFFIPTFSTLIFARSYERKTLEVWPNNGTKHLIFRKE